MPFNSTNGGLSARAYGFRNSGVPDAPSAPTVSSVANEATDIVTWSAPKNNGSPITIYYWESTDGKSGSTSSTSVNVTQESGTSQQYRVRAVNSNGTSPWSSYSLSFTSFSFSPFGFTPFGFTPFGFTPFGFTPFGFTPYAWLDGGNSLAPELMVSLSSFDYKIEKYTDITKVNVEDMLESFDINNKIKTTTKILSISQLEDDKAMLIDGDVYTYNHKMFVRKNNIESFINVSEIDTTYEKYSVNNNDFISIYSVEKIEIPILATSLICDPINNYLTNNVVLSDI